MKPVPWSRVPATEKDILRLAQEELLAAYRDVVFGMSIERGDKQRYVTLHQIREGAFHLLKEKDPLVYRRDGPRMDDAFWRLEASDLEPKHLVSAANIAYKKHQGLIDLLRKMVVEDDDIICSIDRMGYVLHLYAAGPYAKGKSLAAQRLRNMYEDFSLPVTERDGKGFYLEVSQAHGKYSDALTLRIWFENPGRVQADRLLQALTLYDELRNELTERDARPPLRLEDTVTYFGWEKVDSPHLWLPKKSRERFSRARAKIERPEGETISLEEIDEAFSSLGFPIEALSPSADWHLVSARKVCCPILETGAGEVEPTLYLLAHRREPIIQAAIGYFPAGKPRILEPYASLKCGFQEKG
ncbi:MAG: hypothetical protein V1735_01685 [Nanoarchaeota archaeon]